MNLLDLKNPPNLDNKPRTGVLDEKSLQTERDRLGPDSVAAGVLLLWHDHWEDAHGIAQTHEGDRDHDLLHALAHRREGDYGNAGYWFRRTGHHPCFDTLPPLLAPLIAEYPPLLEQMLPGGAWNAEGFLDAVRHGQHPDLLRRIQAHEFRAYFQWLTR